jgi:hypothetical protein
MLPSDEVKRFDSCANAAALPEPCTTTVVSDLFGASYPALQPSVRLEALRRGMTRH